jgi:glycosyltransferase involved in cell wall biosynthesis
MKNRFFILVTQRNAVAFIEKCLSSITAQTYKDYFVIIMDDYSDDGTWEIVQKYCAENENFQAIRNNSKQEYPCKNFITAINTFALNTDILALLSGDDWFYSDDVLKYLNEVYQDDNTWLTYGSFVAASGTWGKDFCKPLSNPRTYRRSRDWYTSHLITCRKKLWDKIRNEDLMYQGHYPNHSFDNAFMYPMVEMAGLKHTKFVEKILYVYNDQNPLNEINFKKDPGACGRERKYWSKQPMYDELKEL